MYLLGSCAKAPAHLSEQKQYSTPWWVSWPAPCASLPPEELPADVSQAAVTLRRLAATASRGNGSRYRRALAAGIAHLDLQDRDQFNLLRRYGPFSTDLRVWVQDDPVPVVQATENLEGRARVTYRLTTEELDWLEAGLQEAGLADVGLAPRRVRAEAWS